MCVYTITAAGFFILVLIAHNGEGKCASISSVDISRSLPYDGEPLNTNTAIHNATVTTLGSMPPSSKIQSAITTPTPIESSSTASIQSTSATTTSLGHDLSSSIQIQGSTHIPSSFYRAITTTDGGTSSPSTNTHIAGLLTQSCDASGCITPTLSSSYYRGKPTTISMTVRGFSVTGRGTSTAVVTSFNTYVNMTSTEPTKIGGKSNSFEYSSGTSISMRTTPIMSSSYTGSHHTPVATVSATLTTPKFSTSITTSIPLDVSSGDFTGGFGITATSSIRQSVRITTMGSEAATAGNTFTSPMSSIPFTQSGSSITFMSLNSTLLGSTSSAQAESGGSMSSSFQFSSVTPTSSMPTLLTLSYSTAGIISTVRREVSSPGKSSVQLRSDDVIKMTASQSNRVQSSPVVRVSYHTFSASEVSTIVSSLSSLPLSSKTESSRITLSSKTEHSRPSLSPMKTHKVTPTIKESSRASLSSSKEFVHSTPVQTLLQYSTHTLNFLTSEEIATSKIISTSTSIIILSTLLQPQEIYSRSPHSTYTSLMSGDNTTIQPTPITASRTDTNNIILPTAYSALIKKSSVSPLITHTPPTATKLSGMRNDKPLYTQPLCTYVILHYTMTYNVYTILQCHVYHTSPHSIT